MENIIKAKKSLLKELETVSKMILLCSNSEELLEIEQLTIYKRKKDRLEKIINALEYI
jgi:hypothetical protein